MQLDERAFRRIERSVRSDAAQERAQSLEGVLLTASPRQLSRRPGRPVQYGSHEGIAHRHLARLVRQLDRKTVLLPASHLPFLEQEGEGNLSEGIRIVIEKERELRYDNGSPGGPVLAADQRGMDLLGWLTT